MAVDQQAKVVAKYLNLKDLTDPAKVAKLLNRFSAMYDAKNASQTYSPVLDLFQGSSSGTSGFELEIDISGHGKNARQPVVMKSSIGALSSSVGGPDPSSDFSAFLPFDDTNVVLTLQVQPELRAIAEIADQAVPRVRRDTSASIQNIGDPPRGNADVERKPVCTEPARNQLAFEQPSGMNEWSHGCQPL